MLRFMLFRHITRGACADPYKTLVGIKPNTWQPIFTPDCLRSHTLVLRTYVLMHWFCCKWLVFDLCLRLTDTRPSHFLCPFVMMTWSCPCADKPYVTLTVLPQFFLVYGQLWCVQLHTSLCLLCTLVSNFKYCKFNFVPNALSMKFLTLQKCWNFHICIFIKLYLVNFGQGCIFYRSHPVVQ